MSTEKQRVIVKQYVAPPRTLWTRKRRLWQLLCRHPDMWRRKRTPHRWVIIEREKRHL